MRKIIEKTTRIAAFALALLAAGGAWAATALRTTYDSSSSAKVVIDNYYNNTFNNCNTTASGAQITIPSTGSITQIRITSLDFAYLAAVGTTKDHAPSAISITVDGVEYKSAVAVKDTTNKMTNSGSSANDRMVYSFAGVDCILTVGTSYNLKFYNADGSEKTTPHRFKTCDANGAATIISGWNYNTTYVPLLEFTGYAVSCVTLSGGSQTLSTLSGWDVAPQSDTTDYVFSVTDDTDLSVDSAKSATTFTFDVTSGKTLTLAGSSAITASSGIYVNGGTVALPSGNSSMLDGSFKGDGTIEFTNVYATPLNLSSKGVANSDWKGTLAFKSVTAKSGWQFSYLGNANSTVRFDGVTDGYFNAKELFEGTVDIASGGLVLHYGNGGGTLTRIKKLTGSGEFKITGGSSYNGGCSVCVQNVDDYTGKFNLPSGANQQLTIGETGTCSTSCKIIIAEGYSATPGVTWEADGGIEVNGTLTLNSAIGMPMVAGGTGTIICNQKVPNNDGLIASTWKGTLQINGDVGPNANTKICNAASTLKIASGSVTLTDVTSLPGKVVIASGATLNISNAGITEFTLGAVENSGTLDLSGCTSLTTLNFALGTNRTVDLGLANVAFKLPDSYTTCNNVSLTEAAGEGGATVISSSLLPYMGVVSYTLTHINGTAIADFNTSTGSSSITLTYVPQIDGAATALDATFTNTLNLAYSKWSGVTSMQHDGVYENPQLPVQYNNNLNDKSTGVYLKYHPYVNGISGKIKTIQDRMTMAVVGTMSPTANRMFIHMGLSTGSSKGLLLTRTENENEVLVAYNTGTTVTPITMMTVPNCSTARHVYIITKEDGASSTTFTVYLDGIKWKTVTTESVIAFSDNNANVQVGSDSGGAIKGDSSATYKPVNIQASVEDEPGVISVMRLYDRIITAAEIAAYTAEYPYTSPNGSSARTFTAAAENWIDQTPSSEVWVNSSGGNSGTPLSGASLNVTAGVDTEVTVNLSSDASYEALTLGGSSMTFASSSGGGKIRVIGMTVVGATVTNEYGAVDMSGGPMTITEDGDITFDYSAYDASAIYTTTDVALTSDVDEDATKVHLIAPVTPYRSYSLVYTSGHYAMRVTPNHQAGDEIYYTSGYWGTPQNPSDAMTVTISDGTPTAVFPNDTVVVDSHATGGNASSAYVDSTLPANVAVIKVDKNYTFEPGVDNAILGGATVTITEGNMLTFGATWHTLDLGAVTLNGPGSVTMSSNASASGAVAGTAPITIAANKTLTVTSTGSIANSITLNAGGSLVVQSGGSATVPTTSVASSYVKAVTDAGTTTYSVQAYATVTIPSGVEHATATVNGDAVASGSSVQVDVGTDVTIAWTPASGYKITAGATQAINAIAESVTATAPTVEAMDATVSGVTFTYGADYTTAIVTATVTGDATSATLSYGGQTYNADVENGTVTFNNVAVSRGNDIYAPVAYEITAKEGDASVTTTGGTGSSVAADSTAWVNENAGTTGTAAAGGSWSNEVTYANNVASVSDNTFTAVNCSTGDLVTVTVENVVYTELSDMDVSGIAADSQGAVCLGTNVVNDAVQTNFMILAKEDSAFVWKPAAWSGTPAFDTPYNVEFTFDYTHGKYSVKINGTALSTNSVTAFDLCTEQTSVKAVDFMGAGTLSAIQGAGYSGYMVKDSVGNCYATIADAIAAYSDANGPYFVLHSYSAGSVPSGWKVETVDGVMVLKRNIKGVMILTY